MKSKRLWIAMVVLLAVLIGIVVWQQQQPAQQEEKVIKIGAILPLTGPAASFGQYVKEGIDLAVDEVNKESQIKFSIIYGDSKTSPKEAVAIFNRMVEINKTSIVIAALSSVAGALKPLSIEKNTILLYVDVAKPGVADGEHSFRIYPEANGTSGVIARFIANELKAKTAAILYINDDYGLASFEVFKNIFELLGGRVVFSEIYNFIQKDFRNIFIKLKGVKTFPDVIYINGYGPSFAKAIKQFREEEYFKNCVIAADVALGLPENLKLIGEAAEGAYFVDANLSSQFVKEFKRKYNKVPSSDAGYAYDAIKIIYYIIKNNSIFTTDDIRQGLQNLTGFQGVTGTITMKENGDANLQFVVKQIRNGVPQVVSMYSNGEKQNEQ